MKYVLLPLFLLWAIAMVVASNKRREVDFNKDTEGL